MYLVRAPLLPFIHRSVVVIDPRVDGAALLEQTAQFTPLNVKSAFQREQERRHAEPKG